MCIGIFLFQSYLLKMELLTCPEPIVSNHGQEITCYSTMKFKTCTQENISSKRRNDKISKSEEMLRKLYMSTRQDEKKITLFLPTPHDFQKTLDGVLWSSFSILPPFIHDSQRFADNV